MPTPPAKAHPSPAVHACGVIALAGVAVFTLVCTAVQFLRHDYNWLGIPLSFYVIGPYGKAVEASFFALAPGLAATGIGWYRALGRGARSAAPLLLFVVTAIALCVTAVEFTNLPNRPATLHGVLHIIAAATTFLCVTVAMLLQSLRLRHDPRWRPRHRPALALAAVSFVALWLVALVPGIPRGLGEKTVIALILAWLWRSGWWLARDRMR